MAKLTEEEVLKWDNAKLESTVKANSAKFAEGPISPVGKEAKNNPVTRSLQQIKGKWENTHRKRVRLQSWLIPAVIVVATGGIFLATGNGLRPAELVFVFLIIATLIYLWLSGKVAQWAKKKLDFLIKESERFASIYFERSVETWARKRYTLPEGNITWGSYGSEFRLEGASFAWKEDEPDSWIIVDSETRKEAPLKSVK